MLVHLHRWKKHESFSTCFSLGRKKNVFSVGKRKKETIQVFEALGERSVLPTMLVRVPWGFIWIGKKEMTALRRKSTASLSPLLDVLGMVEMFRTAEVYSEPLYGTDITSDQPNRQSSNCIWCPLVLLAVGVDPHHPMSHGAMNSGACSLQDFQICCLSLKKEFQEDRATKWKQTY